jgi:hypothetical protein
MGKELIHKDCGGEIEVKMDGNNACGDPECCGAYEEKPVLTCKKCGKHEKIY